MKKNSEKEKCKNLKDIVVIKGKCSIKLSVGFLRTPPCLEDL